MPWTALHTACVDGDEEEVKRLLAEDGADPDVSDASGLTPLHVAAEGGKSSIVELLLSKSAQANCVTCMSEATPAHLAAEEGHDDVISTLVRHKADIDRRTSDTGVTPLGEAARNNRLSTIKLLLSHGADPNIQGNEGRSPLHWTLVENLPESASLLVKANADVNLPDVYGVTPASLAVSEPLQRAVGSWTALLIASLMQSFVKKLAEKVTRETGFFNRPPEALAADPRFKRLFCRKELDLFILRQTSADPRLSELTENDLRLTSPYFANMDHFILRELRGEGKGEPPPPLPRKKGEGGGGGEGGGKAAKRRKSPPRTTAVKAKGGVDGGGGKEGGGAGGSP